VISPLQEYAGCLKYPCLLQATPSLITNPAPIYLRTSNNPPNVCDVPPPLGHRARDPPLPAQRRQEAGPRLHAGSSPPRPGRQASRAAHLRDSGLREDLLAHTRDVACPYRRGCRLLGFSRRTTRSAGLFIALGLGFLLHQALDAMWLQPATWFWPLLGPFPPGEEIPFVPYILADILQPAEWLAGTAFLFLLAGLRGDVHPGVRISAGLSVLLGFSAFWLILSAAGGSFCPLTGWDSRGDNLVVASSPRGAICIDWERGRVMPGGRKDPP